MNSNGNESIFKSILRSFFKAFFAMMGILVGLAIIGALFSKGSMPKGIDDNLKMTTLPNSHQKVEPFAPDKPYFLQINIKSMIGGERGITYEYIANVLRHGVKAPLNPAKLKGLLLYMDSPGGVVTDADTIYEDIVAFKKKYQVPIYTYVNGLCCSGGYYIASATDQIYSSPISIIGSVGVKIGPLVNVADLAQKIGVKTLTLSDGKYKEPFPTFNKIPDDYENMKSLEDLKIIIQGMYERFVEIVAKSRSSYGLTEEKLKNEYGATVFFAPTAKEYGYIDNPNATYMDCVQALMKEAGLEEDQTCQIITFNEPSWLFPLATAKMKSLLQIDATTPLSLAKQPLQFYYLYQ